jgi:hypothetical protein
MKEVSGPGDVVPEGQLKIASKGADGRLLLNFH